MNKKFLSAAIVTCSLLFSFPVNAACDDLTTATIPVSAGIDTSTYINSNISDPTLYSFYSAGCQRAMQDIGPEILNEFASSGGKLVFSNNPITYINMDGSAMDVSSVIGFSGPFRGGVYTPGGGVDATTGNICASYYVDKQYTPSIMISLYNSNDHNTTTEEVICHEFGHFIDGGTVKTTNVFSDTPEWNRIYTEEHLDSQNPNAEFNPGEFFAEEYKYYSVRNSEPALYKEEVQNCPQAQAVMSAAVEIRKQQGNAWLNIPQNN